MVMVKREDVGFHMEYRYCVQIKFTYVRIEQILYAA